MQLLQESTLPQKLLRQEPCNHYKNLHCHRSYSGKSIAITPRIHTATEVTQTRVLQLLQESTLPQKLLRQETCNHYKNLHCHRSYSGKSIAITPRIHTATEVTQTRALQLLQESTWAQTEVTQTRALQLLQEFTWAQKLLRQEHCNYSKNPRGHRSYSDKSIAITPRIHMGTEVTQTRALQLLQESTLPQKLLRQEHYNYSKNPHGHRQKLLRQEHCNYSKNSHGHRSYSDKSIAITPRIHMGTEVTQTRALQLLQESTWAQKLLRQEHYNYSKNPHGHRSYSDKSIAITPRIHMGTEVTQTRALQLLQESTWAQTEVTQTRALQLLQEPHGHRSYSDKSIAITPRIHMGTEVTQTRALQLLQESTWAQKLLRQEHCNYSKNPHGHRSYSDKSITITPRIHMGTEVTQTRALQLLQESTWAQKLLRQEHCNYSKNPHCHRSYSDKSITITPRIHMGTDRSYSDKSIAITPRIHMGTEVTQTRALQLLQESTWAQTEVTQTRALQLLQESTWAQKLLRQEHCNYSKNPHGHRSYSDKSIAITPRIHMGTEVTQTRALQLLQESTWAQKLLRQEHYNYSKNPHGHRSYSDKSIAITPRIHMGTEVTQTRALQLLQESTLPQKLLRQEHCNYSKNSHGHRSYSDKNIAITPRIHMGTEVTQTRALQLLQESTLPQKLLRQEHCNYSKNPHGHRQKLLRQEHYNYSKNPHGHRSYSDKSITITPRIHTATEVTQTRALQLLQESTWAQTEVTQTRALQLLQESTWAQKLLRQEHYNYSKNSHCHRSYSDKSIAITPRIHMGTEVTQTRALQLLQEFTLPQKLLRQEHCNYSKNPHGHRSYSDKSIAITPRIHTATEVTQTRALQLLQESTWAQKLLRQEHCNYSKNPHGHRSFSERGIAIYSNPHGHRECFSERDIVIDPRGRHDGMLPRFWEITCSINWYERISLHKLLVVMVAWSEVRGRNVFLLFSPSLSLTLAHLAGDIMLQVAYTHPVMK